MPESFPSRQRPSRRKQKTAALQRNALFLQLALQPVNCAMRQPPRLLAHPLDELARLPRRHSFRRVIRLPELVRKRVHQVYPLPRQNNRRPLFDGHRNDRGPPRMHTKPHCCLFRMSHSEEPTPAALPQPLPAQSPAPSSHWRPRHISASRSPDSPGAGEFHFPA